MDKAIFEIKGIKTLFRRGKQILHEEGFPSLFKRLSSFVHCPYFIYENILCIYPNITCKVDNLVLKVITITEEIDRLLAEGSNFSSYEISIQQCKERLGRGAIFFCAFVNNEIAHGSWIGMSRKAADDFFHFPVDYRQTACIGGTMTIPKFRRKNINLYVHSKMYQYIRKKGLSKAVLEIHKDNIAARNSQAKLGSYIIGEGCQIRLLLSLLNFRWIKLQSWVTSRSTPRHGKGRIGGE